MVINLSDSEAGPLGRRAIPPQLSSSIYTIIGFAWPVFGCVFITLLCSTDWFALKIIPFFPLAVLLALLIGHLVASFLESERVTSFCYFFKRGMPLIFYRRFAFVEEPMVAGADGEAQADSDLYGKAAITFGQRRVLLSAVDELYLTLLGTLEIRSYAASGRLEPRGGGPAVNRPDILVKVPLSVLGLSAEKQLVELFRAHRPDLVVNKRLTDRLASPVVKGQALIQSFGALVIVLALVDVSYATFTWLEIVKAYYGAQICLRHADEAGSFIAAGEKSEVAARRLFAEAEELRLHPSPVSWAYRALFANANSQAQLLSIKAETLYRLGQKDQAIDCLKQALELSTTGYKTQLQLARYLAEAGRREDAQAALAKVVKRHKEALLPRVYGQAIELKDDAAAAEARYNQDLADLDKDLFGSEPAWPPGGEKPIMEVWRRDDLTFLAERFFKGKQK